MEMHHVRYFLALCETLNFTRAAAQCNVSQPALTRAIKQLEAELGGQLVRRERDHSHLTELGELMRTHLASIHQAHLKALNSAEEYLTQDQSPVTLGVMVTINPARLVGFFEILKRRVPNLDLRLTEKPGHLLVEDVAEGRLDVAIVAMPDYPERFRVRPLFRERYAIAFPPGHRFQDTSTVPFQDLTGENYISRVHCEFRAHFDAIGGGELARTNVRLHTEREDWAQALVLAGMGVSVMPEANAVLPGLQTRVIVEPEVTRTVSFVDLAGRPYPPAMQAVIRTAESFDWDVAL